MTSHATPTAQVMKIDAVRVFIPRTGAPGGRGMTDHIHAYAIGPSQAMEEDGDLRARCGCGQREPMAADGGPVTDPTVTAKRHRHRWVEKEWADPDGQSRVLSWWIVCSVSGCGA